MGQQLRISNWTIQSLFKSGLFLIEQQQKNFNQKLHLKNFVCDIDRISDWVFHKQKREKARKECLAKPVADGFNLKVKWETRSFHGKKNYICIPLSATITFSQVLLIEFFFCIQFSNHVCACAVSESGATIKN